MTGFGAPTSGAAATNVERSDRLNSLKLRKHLKFLSSIETLMNLAGKVGVGFSGGFLKAIKEKLDFGMVARRML
uniref:Uncharacterized protein n=1 Tax=Romanomermis culicivorax TaxID=13658 RepID=A0A915IC99_ROMCU